jgi:hypothetical protein
VPDVKRDLLPVSGAEGATAVAPSRLAQELVTSPDMGRFTIAPVGN